MIPILLAALIVQAIAILALLKVNGELRRALIDARARLRNSINSEGESE